MDNHVRAFLRKSLSGRAADTSRSSRDERRFVGRLSSAKTPSDLTPFNIPWPNSGNSLLKVVIAQKASVIVGLQPVIQVNVVQIGRYHFFAEFVSFRT